MTSCLKNKDSRIFGYDHLKALSMLGIVFYHLHSIRFGEIPADGSLYYPGVGKSFYGLPISAISVVAVAALLWEVISSHKSTSMFRLCKNI